MKSKELSIDTIVVSDRSEQGYKTISNTLSVPRSTVASIIVKWKKFGMTRTLPRVGRCWGNRALTTIIHLLTQGAK